MALTQTKTTIASYAGIELIEVYTPDYKITEYLVYDGEEYHSYCELKNAVVDFGLAMNRQSYVVIN